MNDRKKASKSYYDRRHGNALAKAGYWKHDYKYISEAVRAAAPSSLIDIGCGTGAFLQYLSENRLGIKLYGLDLSEGMVKEVNDRMGTKATVYQGDSEHMPLQDSQFDFVTCNMSIHHYPQAQLAVNEMHRILKPGGTLCINDMDCIAPIRWLANKAFPHMKSGDVKMYCRQEIEDMLGTAGLSAISYKKISPFSFLCTAKKG